VAPIEQSFILFDMKEQTDFILRKIAILCLLKRRERKSHFFLVNQQPYWHDNAKIFSFKLACLY